MKPGSSCKTGRIDQSCCGLSYATRSKTCQRFSTLKLNIWNDEVVTGVKKMKEEVFFGESMPKVKKEYKDLYEAIVHLNEAVYTGKTLDYKTQKLIALGINAAVSDERATKKQMLSAMKEFNASKDEIGDVLRMVLLTAGMPPFVKAMRVLYELKE
jgi:alkylhydroperoxidase/carboxymuconolactone decarboxylase family protein YurZ